MSKSKITLVLASSLVVAAAAAAHTANAAYCRSLGDDSQLPWDDAPESQRLSAIAGVEFHVANPDATDSAAHENWMKQKLAEGWVFGEEKDVDKKTHPCLVPFDELPKEQQFKDALFRAVVRGFIDNCTTDDANAGAAALDADLANVRQQIDSIGAAVVPLGQYLETEGVLVRGQDEQVTVEQIATTALEALQSVKAHAVELQAKVDELTPEPKDVPSAKQVKLPASIADEQFGKACTVAFANEYGKLCRDLPPITFSSDKFTGSAQGRTLMADVEFPVHGAAATVASAVLLDAKSKVVAVCNLVMPLAVSGGRSARINGGSLLFRTPAKAA